MKIAMAMVKTPPNLPILVFLICLLNVASLGGQEEQITNSFETANKLYEQGQFAAAAEEYARLLEAGRSNQNVLFNFGNASFRSGKIGVAILAYSRAEAISPRDPDIQANLRFARAQVSGPSLRLSWVEANIRRLTVNEWTYIAVFGFWTGFGLLTLSQFLTKFKNATRLGIAAASFLTVGCGTVAAWSYHKDHTNPRAVILERQVIVRNGPFDESQEAFRLSDGAELRILDKKYNWYQVAAGKQQLGWVKAELLGLL